MGTLIKVNEVEAFISPTPPHVPVLACHLEDGRSFYLYYVPVEIVIAINNMMGGGYVVDRESLYDILMLFRDEIVNVMRKRIERVIVDEINPETLLYSATVEIRADGVLIKRKMVPSHAIYLALLAGKDIYVDKKLVDQQERIREKVR